MATHTKSKRKYIYEDQLLKESSYPSRPLASGAIKPLYIEFDIIFAAKAPVMGTFKWIKGLLPGGKVAAKGGLQYTKSSLKLGQEMHKAYKVGANGVKEFRLPSGKRIDFLDINNKTIYELKPFNPRAMKAGQRQLDMYLKELQTIPEYKGFNWKTVLDTY